MGVNDPDSTGSAQIGVPVSRPSSRLQHIALHSVETDADSFEVPAVFHFDSVWALLRKPSANHFAFFFVKRFWLYAIATACFCGRPAAISAFTFAENTRRLVPF